MLCLSLFLSPFCSSKPLELINQTVLVCVEHLYPRCYVTSVIITRSKNVNIFVFSCYILNQIEVFRVFCKVNNAVFKSRKTAEPTRISLVHPLAVFVDLKRALFS